MVISLGKNPQEEALPTVHVPLSNIETNTVLWGGGGGGPNPHAWGVYCEGSAVQLCSAWKNAIRLYPARLPTANEGAALTEGSKRRIKDIAEIRARDDFLLYKLVPMVYNMEE